MQKQKAAISEIHSLWESEILSGLGYRDHLRPVGGRGGSCHDVSSARVAVDGVDAAFASDKLGERN
jgi:hypothetical protein